MLVALIPSAALLGLSVRTELLVRLLLPAAALAWFWKGIPPLHVRCPATSILIGAATFVIWVAPEVVWPAWRSHWLFQNQMLGHLSLPSPNPTNPVDLLLRSLRACLVVAAVEELFWRGWLMRWMIRANSEAVPVGAWQARAFLVTAALFALEHGPYWDVGLAAGLIYNWWALRTRSLGDLMLAHGVTNALLAIFVIVTHRWSFWM